MLTSDAGLLPIRQFDQQIGLTEQFAAALTDLRYQPSVEHKLSEMVRMRIFGILADYPDQNDHDVLRSDPVFKLIAGRSPDADDLASQPTLSRFENAIDDPTHGQQQLTFFHGYYRQYQYLPRLITCAENDLVVMVCLLFGTAHAALGAGDDLRYLVGRLREAFPGVRIHLRADSGFGVPAMYEASEHLEIDYTIGIAMNATLKKKTDALLDFCLEQFDQTGQPQRRFAAYNLLPPAVDQRLGGKGAFCPKTPQGRPKHASRQFHSQATTAEGD